MVAGPGVAPGLEDYEPSVQLYTTPHILLISRVPELYPDIEIRTRVG